MVSLSENSIVLNPQKELTRTQRDTLKAIAYFRRQRRAGSQWLVGDKRISVKVISELERLDLISENHARGESFLKLTTAGNLVTERLRP